MEKKLGIWLIALLCISCAKHEFVVETRDVDSFSGLFLNSSFEVVIHRDSISRIVLSGSSDVIEEIDISRQADTIAIESNYFAKWLQPDENPIRLDIYCDSLSKILLTESCDLSSSDPLRSEEIGLIAVSRLQIVNLEFDAKTVYYWNNFPCNGVIRFSGQVDELKLWNTALMQVDASELISDYVLVENDSGEDCKVHANDFLEYSITGAGNILVSGNPEILPPGDESGTGQLIILE